ncbi:MAG TPA: hypothetical protein VI488_08475 [Candidatus Angelobacter sp.]
MTGNATPNDTINGSATLLASPQYLFVDVTNNRLFVANQGAGSILVFENASTKNGNVAPERNISGPSTTLVGPVDMALDSSRNLLYVADGANVLVFASASTVTGNTAPVRTIAVGFSVDAILLDSGGDRMFLVDGTGNAINVYDSASTLSHVVSPNRTISGPHTQLSAPAGLQLDSLGRLVVSNLAGKAITIYANAVTASGNISPNASMTGSNTQLAGPTQIAVTTSNNTLFVADGIAASVLVFANLNTSSGNAVPTNAIKGANTGFARSAGGTGPATAKGVALDPTR